jgi:hypothetical protein
MHIELISKNAVENLKTGGKIPHWKTYGFQYIYTLITKTATRIGIIFCPESCKLVALLQ